MGCVFSNTGSQRQGCVIMGCHFLAQVSDKFAFSLFDLDWDVFMQHIEGAVNRVPVLEQTGIKSTVCGPGTHTHTPREHLCQTGSVTFCSACRILHGRPQTSDGRSSRGSRFLPGLRLQQRRWVFLLEEKI